MKRLIILTIILILCFSLPLGSKTTPAKQLKANLDKWQTFQWQGIIQVQSSALSMRKDFVLAKTADALRIDILDSGVMGLGATPLVSLYMKDKAVLSAPTIEQLKGIDLNWFLPPGTVTSLVHFTDSLLIMQKEILSKKKVQTGNTEYTFDKKYRLSGIKSPGTGLKAIITYNNSNQPTKIRFEHAGSQVAEMLINERKYNGISIVPLMPDPNSLNLEEMLQGIDLQGITPDSLDLEKLMEGVDPKQLEDLEGLEGLELE
jgi:hypothetical protein